MAKKKVNRAKPTYVYSILSMSLVLYMLGLLGMVVLHASQLSEYFREQIEISVILKDGVKDADIFKLQQEVDAKNFVNASEYVTKDQAAKNLQEQYGEDFLDILEFNPLYSSINLNLKAQYAVPDSMGWIEEELGAMDGVKEVYYYKDLLTQIDSNVKKVGFLLIAISIVLFLIAVSLIDNTIRLAMYSNRFLIKSMQLVGATRWFVMKPFVGRGLFNGLVSVVMAVVGLAFTSYYLLSLMPEMARLQDPILMFGLLVLIVGTGMLISWWSTRKAAVKYLKTQLDQLY